MTNAYMQTAIREAERAYEAGEIPVGAAIFREGKLIASAHNVTQTQHDPTGHAELVAIRAAGQALGDWRLDGCDLYVTLEPCPMCAAAICNARIRRLYFGAFDKRYGAAGTRYNYFARNPLGNVVEVYGGICETACTQILTRFFENLRK